MGWFRFRLVGYQEEVVLEVEEDSLRDLAQSLCVRRFLEARIIPANGEGAVCDILVPVQRIAMIAEVM